MWKGHLRPVYLQAAQRAPRSQVLQAAIYAGMNFGVVMHVERIFSVLCGCIITCQLKSLWLSRKKEAGHPGGRKDSGRELGRRLTGKM